MSKKHDINRWIFDIPLSDIRVPDYDDQLTKEPCICCGKEVRNPKYHVHLLTSGQLVSTAEPFAEDEDQGFHVIGTACRLKLPNNFTFKIGQ